MASFSKGTQADRPLVRAARRSAQDMREERVKMIRRHAPLAVIQALDLRIAEAERIMREGEANEIPHRG